MRIRELKREIRVEEIVEIHMQSFPGFFLTFLGRGFLCQLYRGFLEYPEGGILTAVDDGRIVGFLAYTSELSGFYKFLLKKHLIPFAWYGMLGCLKKPRIFFRLLRAFFRPREARRREPYMELSSIGVLPSYQRTGAGGSLISALKKKASAAECSYIKLETDAEHNHGVNCFYQKHGFVLDHAYETWEGRRMNEYRYEVGNR